MKKQKSLVTFKGGIFDPRDFYKTATTAYCCNAWTTQDTNIMRRNPGFKSRLGIVARYYFLSLLPFFICWHYKKKNHIINLTIKNRNVLQYCICPMIDPKPYLKTWHQMVYLYNVFTVLSRTSCCISSYRACVSFGPRNRSIGAAAKSQVCINQKWCIHCVVSKV